MSPLRTFADAHLSIEEAVALARSQNPDLYLRRAKTAESIALRASSPSIPPPTLFGTVMGSNGPINAIGTMESSVGLSQTIPFPSKLIAEAKLRNIESNSNEVFEQAENLKIAAQVKSAFFDLYAARETEKLLREKARTFSEHNRRVRAAVLYDRMAQAHRVWIETELDLVENEIFAAKEAEAIAEGRLNIAVGNDPNQKLPELTISNITAFVDQKDDLPPDHPRLKALELSHASAEASVAQAKSLWLPDLSFSYRNARRYDGVMPNYSELTVGITLPFLFFWQTNGQVNAATARADIAQAQIQKMNNDLKMELLEIRNKASSSRYQLLNLQNKIIPQAEKRMNIAHSLVPTDIESMKEQRDAMESVILLKISAVKMRVEYEKAFALLQSLLPVDERKINP